MTTATVIAFDYSGTLSPAAAAFGRPERLTAALCHSGLADAGIATPDAYWHRITAPTWQAASTSVRPFADHIVERLKGAASPAAPSVTDDALMAAARRFVAAYLEASPIAAPWGPLLKRLSRRRDVTLVVATDHYAEATGAIIGHLAAAGMSGAPIRHAAGKSVDALVANSADLGCHKTHPDYWRQVIRELGNAPAALVLVDDFGAGETPASGYAAARDVSHRRERTAAALRAAWDWPIHIHPFAAPSHGTAAAIAAAVDDVKAALGKLFHDL